jgi:hypothetical protein
MRMTNEATSVLKRNSPVQPLASGVSPTDHDTSSP